MIDTREPHPSDNPLRGVEPRDLARACARVLDEMKMDDVTVLDVGSSIQITDYFVVATGRNQRHMKAAGDKLLKKLRELGVSRRGLEGYRDGKWVLIDLMDVIVHLFSAESRKFYDLEFLWGDCPRIEWSEGGEGGGETGPEIERNEPGTESETPAPESGARENADSSSQPLAGNA